MSQADLDSFGDDGDFARQHLLTPAILDLVGDVQGRTMLDAGAGNGYLARILARRGAAVTALEPAGGPFRYIVEREHDDPLGITCLQADLSTVEGLDGQFDIVIANMVLLDIPDVAGAVASCLDALKPGGRFIFSLEHPFTGVGSRGEAPFTVDDYFTERAIPRMIGVNFHRTLETYVDLLADHGAVIERIKEPRLPVDVAAAHPEHAWASRLPAFIVVSARLAGARGG